MENEQKDAPLSDEEKLSFLFTKNYDCKVCEKNFVCFAVRQSKLRVSAIDTDLYPRYQHIDPNHYEVRMCPYCGYAALNAYFDRITDKQAAMVAKEISPHFKPIEMQMPLSIDSVLYRYEMAMKCALASKARISYLALMNLKMAWVYRTCEDKQKEMMHLYDACQGFQEAFTSENFPIAGMDEFTMKYVIGELSRRLGDFNTAMRWIGDVLVAKGLPPALKERASYVKDLVRERVSD